MGIEPTWDFVEPHHGFEDQERHQVALRLRADEARCLRIAPQGLCFNMHNARHATRIYEGSRPPFQQEYSASTAGSGAGVSPAGPLVSQRGY